MAEGSNIIERMLWTLTITGSFAVAGVMVFSNLKDLDENPISTSTDTIPVQVSQLTVTIDSSTILAK